MNPFIQAAANFLLERGEDPNESIRLHRTENIIPLRDQFPKVLFIANSFQAQNFHPPEDNNFSI